MDAVLAPVLLQTMEPPGAHLVRLRPLSHNNNNPRHKKRTSLTPHLTQQPTFCARSQRTWSGKTFLPPPRIIEIVAVLLEESTVTKFPSGVLKNILLLEPA